MLLLTDGTVMCQQSNSRNWFRLRPDEFGDYVKGTWTALTPMQDARLYYASAVLQDGRVLVAGGEYSGGNNVVDLNAAEIYNPMLDQWTSIGTPAGWTAIGDAPCCVLPDGKMLLGSIMDAKTAVFDPITGTWTAAASKDDSSSEETWTLLPDETVLTVECNGSPRAEKYLAVADRWVSAGSTPVDIVQPGSVEIGPAMLMPDGRLFCIGSTGHNVIYAPPAQADSTGTWQQAPDFPADANGNLMQAKDAPCCMLPNGNVLCVAGPASASSGDYPGPTSFFEFDGTALIPVPAPGNAGGAPFMGRMMLLPTGQVLFAAGTAQAYVYTPEGLPDEDWRPEITDCPTNVRKKQTYTLHGRLLNGISGGVSYGDDASSFTNYPIVKIRNVSSGRVRYCRTGDHSTMGVATGLSIQSTTFKVPIDAESGAADLYVVANGIESAPVRVTIGPFLLRWHLDQFAIKSVLQSFAGEEVWALGQHGPVPVSPEQTELRQKARAAYDDVKQAVAVLEEVGRQIEGDRQTAAPEEAPVQHSRAGRRTKVRA
jgi:hypothetical protein